MRNVGRAAQSAVQPHQNLVKAVQKGNLTLHDAGRLWKNQGDIMMHQRRLMGNMSSATLTMGERLSMANIATNALGRSLVKTGKNIQWAGRQVTVGLTVPLAFFAKRAKDAAQAFDEQMTRVIKVYNFTTDQVELETESLRMSMERMATSMADSLGFVAEESLGVMAEFAQMGRQGLELQTITSETLRIARLGGVELSDATNLARSVTQAFGEDVSQLTDTFNRFNLIENETALGIQDLAEGLPIVANVAKRLGLTSTQTAAALATMKEAGIGARESATALRTGLIKLVDEITPKAIRAFAELGINIEAMQAEHGANSPAFLKDLADSISTVAASSDEAGDEIVRAISALTGVRQASRILAVMDGIAQRFDEGTAGARAFAAAEGDVGRAARSAQEELERWQESAAGTADVLDARLSVQMARLGGPILRASNAIKEMAVSILDWFNSLDEGMQSAIMRFGAFVAAIGPIGMIVGILANAFGTVISVMTRIMSILPGVSATLITAEEAAEKAIRTTTHGIWAQTAALKANADAKLSNAGATMTMAGAETADVAASGMPGLHTLREGPRRTLGGRIRGGFSRLGGRFARPAASAAAGRGGFAAIGEAGVAGISSIIPKLLSLGKLVAIVSGIGAAIAVLLPIIIAVATNFDKFKKGVMDLASGPINALKQGFQSLRNLWAQLTSDAGESGLGGRLSSIAERVGQVVGWLIGAAANLGTAFMDLLNGPLQGMFDIFEGIVKMLTGDLWEGLRQIGIGIVRFIAGPILDLMDGLASALDWIGLDGLADGIRRGNDEFREMLGIVEDVVAYVEVLPEEAEKNADALDRINDKQEEYLLNLKAAVAEGLMTQIQLDNVENLTDNQIMNMQGITKEHKAQLFYLRDSAKIQARIAQLEALRVALEERRNALVRGQSREAFIGVTAMQIQEDIRDLAEEMLGLRAEEAGLAQKYLGFLEDTEVAAGGVADEMEEAADNAEDFLNALRSAMQDRMGDIADAVGKALDEQLEVLKEQFETRKEQIEETKDRELERIEAIKEEEELLDKERQRWFERQRARLEYFENRDITNIQIESALARGELDEAAILRVRSRTNTEEFFLDQLERESDARKEARDEHFDTLKEQTEARADALKEQIDMEEEAAIEAFELRRRYIERDLEVWQKVTPQTEAEFQQHMGELERILSRHGVEVVRVVKNYSIDAGGKMKNAFRDAVKDAQDYLSEERKWEKAAEAARKAIERGLKGGAGQGIVGTVSKEARKAMQTLAAHNQWAAKAQRAVQGFKDGFREGWNSNMAPMLEDAYERLITTDIRKHLIGVNDSSNPRVPTTGQFDLNFHQGGSTDISTPRIPGLRRDELPAVLQKGEYVVQKKAVDKLGVSYMDAINKFHDGGFVTSGAGAAMNMKVAEMAKQVLLQSAMSGPSSDEFTQGGGPRWWKLGPKWGRLADNTAAALSFIKKQWGNNIVSAFAGTNRGDPSSDHSYGKAIDVMFTSPGTYADPSEKQAGWSLADWFINKSGAYGTKYVIWQKMINSGTGWRDYGRYGSNPGATLGHYDHVHLSFLHDGGLAAPKFHFGGMLKKDSLINAKKGEAVVRQPLSQAFVDMVNSGGGGGSTYELTVNVYGSDLNEEELARKIKHQFDKMERKKGRNRSAGGR